MIPLLLYSAALALAFLGMAWKRATSPGEIPPPTGGGDDSYSTYLDKRREARDRAASWPN